MAETIANVTSHMSEEDEKQRLAELNSLGNLLVENEIVDGYTVHSRLEVSSGESQIYRCIKGQDWFVLKYYFIQKPKRTVSDTLKSIDHPNILKPLTSGSYKEHFYEILEYVPGGALDDKLPDGSYKYLPLTTEKTLELLGEVNEAFHAYHSHNPLAIIHRDIKPANLFYRDAKEEKGKWVGSHVLVADFGIASELDTEGGATKRQTKTMSHTPGYAAPELFSSIVGPETDYYALGITLWVLLTGLEPFVDDSGEPLSDSDIIHNAIRGRTADILLERSPDIDGRFHSLIRGLLTVKSKSRWGYDEVKRFLAGETVPVETDISFSEAKVLGKECSSFEDMAKAILDAYRKDSKWAIEYIFGEEKQLIQMLIDNDNSLQKYAEDVGDILGQYDKNRDEGVFVVAYSLFPALPFTIKESKESVESKTNHDKLNADIKATQESTSVKINIWDRAEAKMKVDKLKTGIKAALESAPEEMVKFLRGETPGFYPWLRACKIDEAYAQKLRNQATTIKSDIRLADRLIVTLDDNKIMPFTGDHDKENAKIVLSSLDDLQNLSDRLKERILIFMELNCGIVPAWIENVTNKNLDEWFLIMKTKGGQLEQRGLWASFMNFVGGKIAALERFSKGDGAEKRYGLKDISGTEIVPAEYEDLLEETDGNCFIVMKGGRWGMIQADLHGKEAIPLKYDRILPFCLEKGLFQCKQGPDYFIINHEGNAIELFGDLIGSNGVLQSKYPFFTYPSKQNSFDVVTDNRTLLYDAVLSDEGKVLGFTVKNTFKKVFCIPGSDGKNYVYAKGANDGVEIYTKKGGGYEAVAGLSDYSDFESWAGCALLLVRNTQGKWGLAAPEKGNSVVECTWDYAQLQSPYVLFIGSNKTAGELYDISEKAKLLYRFSFDSLGFKIADPDGKELFDAAYGLGIGPFGLSETFFSPQGFSSRTFIRQGGLWCGASGSVGDFASRTPVLFDIRSGEANLRCGLDTKLGEAVFFTKLDITVQVNILQQWFDKEKLLEANTALDLLMKESSLDDLRFQEYCGKLVLFNPAAKGNTAPGLSKSLDSYCAEAGNRFLKKGDDTASLAHFMNAAQYNAKSDYYQYMLAFICKKKGDTKTALGYIENAINLNPKDAASWSLKGTLLYTEKQHNEAITAFSWAIDIQSDPKKKATYYGNRALAYSAVGMKDKAEADLAAAKLG